jgi:hypothetical protein
MMLVIETQYLENYGTPEEPYWKMKGGDMVKVLGIPLNIDYDAVVDMVRDEIEYKNPYAEKYIIGWGIESDDFLSDFERGQLDYEGEIVFPEPTIEYKELLEMA